MDLIASAQTYLSPNEWYFYLFPEPEQPEVKEETWEDHPVVREFYKINDFEKLTQTERECIAIAYAIHDRHFGVTFDDLVKSNIISQDTVQEEKTKQLVNYLKNRVEESVRSGACPVDDFLPSNRTTIDIPIDIEKEFIQNDWWTKYEELTKDLNKQVESGKIHNIETFYHYMCVEPGHHMDEVLGQGW